MTKKILLFLCVFLMMLPAAGSRAQDSGPDGAVSYADLIFDTSRVHTVDVTMSAADRADQLANPKEKTKYRVDVVIDGEEYQDVSFHTKGNSSLFFTANAGKDKFSYGISFTKYSKDRTFHGLDKLNLQNNCSDAAALKEYMAFWLFRRMGVDAPLASHVWLTVNGEAQGLYTVLEAVEDSFLERTAGGRGTLYKPETKSLALDDAEMERVLAGGSAAHDSDGGADLAYRDDDEKSYPEIFDNAETAEDAGTRGRVIRSLKALSEKEDLEEYLDTAEIIRYFAVHNFLVSYDSYTGPMLHNFYLYERDGRLAMLPWDYDASYGCFPPDAVRGHNEDSTTVINTGIDSPLGGIADEARPMWSWIPSDESYRNAYHEALLEVAGIIESGEFGEEAGRVFERILPYMEKDPKAFYPPERVRKAYPALLEFTQLRAESVLRQVNGRLAARSELQNEKDRVDASGLFIKDMGSLGELFN